MTEFNGNPTEYAVCRKRIATFADKFPAVDSYVKYEALKSLLAEPVRALISEYASHPEWSYEAALDRLDRRFHRVDEYEIMVRRINDFGRLDGQRLMDLAEYVRSSIKLFSKEKVRPMITVAVNMFDDAFRELWQRRTEDKVGTDSYEPESELIKFLEAQKMKSVYLQNASVNASNTAASHKAEIANDFNRSKLTCHYCGGNHKMFDFDYI